MQDKRYAGDVARMRSPERMARLEVARVLDLALEGLTAATALDVGTGTGIWAEAFAERGLAVTGIDVREDMLAAARVHVPLGDFRSGDMESLPFEDSAFNLVFMGHVLHEARDLRTALREARRTANLRVLALEWPPEVGEMGPPADHRLQPHEVLTAARAEGFAQAEAIRLEHMLLYRLDVRHLQPWCV